jgi:hypothetical protein
MPSTERTAKGRFIKGVPRPAHSGRKKGSKNKRSIRVRDVLERVARGLGGYRGLLNYIKANPAQQSRFWFELYPKLLPIHTQLEGVGPDGELVITSRVELQKELAARGMPVQFFGVDVPTLDNEASGLVKEEPELPALIEHQPVDLVVLKPIELLPPAPIDDATRFQETRFAAHVMRGSPWRR